MFKKISNIILLMGILLFTSNLYAWSGVSHKGITQKALEYMKQSDNIDHKIAYRLIKSSGIMDAIVRKKPSSVLYEQLTSLMDTHNISSYDELEVFRRENNALNLTELMSYLHYGDLKDYFFYEGLNYVDDLERQCESCSTLSGYADFLYTEKSWLMEYWASKKGLVKINGTDGKYNYNPLYQESDDVDSYKDVFLKFGDKSLGEIFKAAADYNGLSVGVDFDDMKQCLDSDDYSVSSCDELFGSTQYHIPLNPAPNYSLSSASNSKIKQLSYSWYTKYRWNRYEIEKILKKGSSVFNEKNNRFLYSASKLINRFGRNGKYLINKMANSLSGSWSSASKIVDITNKVINGRRNTNLDMTFLDKVYLGSSIINYENDQNSFLEIADKIYDIGAYSSAADVRLINAVTNALQVWNQEYYSRILGFMGSLIDYTLNNFWEDTWNGAVDFVETTVEIIETVTEKVIQFGECLVELTLLRPFEFLFNVLTSALGIVCSGVTNGQYDEACSEVSSSINNFIQDISRHGQIGLKFLGCVTASWINTTVNPSTTLYKLQDLTLIIKEVASILGYEGIYCLGENCLTTTNHFINTGDNEFINRWNDNGGYYRYADITLQDRSAWDQLWDKTGPMFFLTDFVNAKIGYEESDAIKEYNLLNSPELKNHLSAHYYNTREKLDETRFQSVDNLGTYGHEKFLQTKNIQYLGRLLHAAADTSVSHHVGGWLSGGHERFESWADDRFKSQRFIDFIMVKQLLNHFDPFQSGLRVGEINDQKWQLDYKNKKVQEILTSGATYTYAKYSERAWKDIKIALEINNDFLLKNYVKFQTNWSVATIVSALTKSMIEFAKNTGSPWYINGRIRVYPKLLPGFLNEPFPYTESNHPVKANDYSRMITNYSRCDKNKGCKGWSIRFSEFTKGNAKLHIYAMENRERPLISKSLNELANKTVYVYPFQVLNRDASKGFTVYMESIPGVKPDLSSFGYRISEVKTIDSSIVVPGRIIFNPIPVPVVMNSFKLF